MPLYLSFGLPGPFSYVTRLTGKGRRPRARSAAEWFDGRGAIWWLLIGFWALPTYAVVIMTIYVSVFVVIAIWATVRAVSEGLARL